MRNLIGKILIIIADIILMVNLAMWLNISLLGQDSFIQVEYWDFDKYYFGVRSMVNWVNAIPSSIINFNPINYTYERFNEWFYITSLGTYDFNDLLNGINTVDAIISITQFLVFGPFTIIYELVIILIDVGKILVDFIFHFGKLIMGYYNLPLQSYPDLPSVEIPSISIDYV